MSFSIAYFQIFPVPSNTMSPSFIVFVLAAIGVVGLGHLTSASLDDTFAPPGKPIPQYSPGLDPGFKIPQDWTLVLF